MSSDQQQSPPENLTRQEERERIKKLKREQKQWSKAGPEDGIPITLEELRHLATNHKLTPGDGKKFKKALEDYRKQKEEGGETVQNLSFEQIWDKFVERKKKFQKRHGNRPTGVLIGQIEATIFSQFREILETRKMIRMEPGIGGKKRLFINNMYVIVSDAQSCIAPFFIEMGQVGDGNPYAEKD